MDRALGVLIEQASPEQIVNSLLDFSPHARRPAVLRVLRSSAAKRYDAVAFQSAFSEFEQQLRWRCCIDTPTSAACPLIVEPDEVKNELEFVFRRQLQKGKELLPC